MTPNSTMNSSNVFQPKLQFLRGRRDFYAGTMMATSNMWLSPTSAILPMLFGTKGQLWWNIPTTTRCEEAREPSTFNPYAGSSNNNNSAIYPPYSNNKNYSPYQRQQYAQQQQYNPPLDFGTHTDEEYLEAMRRNKKPCFSCMVVSVLTCGGFAAFFAKLAMDVPKNLTLQDPKVRWSPSRVIWTQRFGYMTSAVWVSYAIWTVLIY